MKALVLLADGFEDLQFFHVFYCMQEAGIDVTVASPHMHALTGNHGYVVEPDGPIAEVNPSEYDLLFLPGGAACERLRVREAAVSVTRTFMQEDRLVAAIGHGAQILLSAGSLDGRMVTCSAGIRDDVRAAGALYRDEAYIIDGNLITSRSNADLPAFCGQLLAALEVKTA